MGGNDNGSGSRCCGNACGGGCGAAGEPRPKPSPAVGTAPRRDARRLGWPPPAIRLPPTIPLLLPTPLPTPMSAKPAKPADADASDADGADAVNPPPAPAPPLPLPCAGELRAACGGGMAGPLRLRLTRRFSAPTPPPAPALLPVGVAGTDLEPAGPLPGLRAPHRDALAMPADAAAATAKAACPCACAASCFTGRPPSQLRRPCR